MKVVITGAAGFIGSYVAEILAAEGIRVYGMDNINSYYDPALKFARLQRLGVAVGNSGVPVRNNSSLRFAKMDVLSEDFEAIVKCEKPDMIIHLAARPGVRQSFDAPHECVEDNIQTFVRVLEMCRKYSIPNLLYASSSTVYGDADPGSGFTEDMPVGSPLSVYAVTKRANEMLAEVYSRMYGINIVGMRFFSVYGEWGRPDMAPMIFANSILDGFRIKLFAEGNFKRDFTYIYDVAECICSIVKVESMRKTPRHNIVNIGRGEAVSMSEFVKILEEVLGKKAMVEMLPATSGEATCTLSDSSKVAEEYGCSPRTDLREGLHRFALWLKDWRAGKFGK